MYSPKSIKGNCIYKSKTFIKKNISKKYYNEHAVNLKYIGVKLINID